MKKTVKIPLFICLVIILFYVFYYSLTFIAYKYGGRCQCYGIETSNTCYGIKTMCTGLAPNINKMGRDTVLDSCDSVKNTDSITIDFKECKSCIEQVYVGFGSTTYVIINSQKTNYCEIKYGGEVENPNWDGALSSVCIIPKNLGNVAFEVTNYGVDFSPIRQYCK